MDGLGSLTLRALHSLFLLGWYGAERVFFQRHLEGKAVRVPHLLQLARPFVGRFFVLGVFVGIIGATVGFAVLRILGSDLAQGAAAMPLASQLVLAVLAITMDFLLTFVTPALAYTTRSVSEALGIGVAIIRETWPRSALYVLCPPLALNILQNIFPVGGVALRCIVTSVVVLVGLLAKGAIAAFYLREQGSYSEDGAAYIGSKGELLQASD